MNASTRKKLNGFIGRIEEIITEVESIRDDEQAEYDDKSEKWQSSDKGEAAQEVINQLDQAVALFESAKDEIEKN